MAFFVRETLEGTAGRDLMIAEMHDHKETWWQLLRFKEAAI